MDPTSLILLIVILMGIPAILGLIYPSMMIYQRVILRVL